MAEKGKLLPQCLVCGQVPALGIREGVWVSGNFICESCEQELTTVRQEDQRYAYFVGKIKKLWS